jgi:hypothetical protein
MSKFHSKIYAIRLDWNIFAVLSRARYLMRRLDVPKADIDALSLKVMDAKSYKEAIAAIREWFQVELENEEDEES